MNIADHPLLIGGAVLLAILIGAAVVFGRKRPGRCADEKKWDE